MTTQHVINVQGLEKSFKKLHVLRGVGPFYTGCSEIDKRSHSEFLRIVIDNGEN
jgi:hypothetical protein